jgi:transcription-repair coupling factor (superfamily II helicase)
MLNRVISQLFSLPGVPECIARLERREHVALTGGNPALCAALSLLIRKKTRRPLVIITPGPEAANRWFTNLQTLNEDDTALYSAHTWQEDDLLPNLSINLERMETLSGLLAGTKKAIVVPCLAMLQDVPSPDEFRRCTTLLHAGEEQDMLELIRRFHDQGYERTEMVEFRGDFSVRGGIIDIFPVTADNPVRIEFFGDEIVSIRTFEVHSQRSETSIELEQVFISAASESSIRARTDHDKEAMLLDYFQQEPVVIWYEFKQIIREVNRWENENVLPDIIKYPDLRFNTVRKYTSPMGSLFAQELSIDVPDVLQDAITEITTAPLTLVPARGQRLIEGNTKPYQYNLQAFAEQIRHWNSREYTVTVACSTDADKTRLVELLDREVNIPREWYTAATAVLSDGWILPAIKQALVTDDEIFQRVYTRRRRTRRLRKGKTAPIENIGTINEGEYVVHINHGIGKFEGIKVVELDGVEREMILVRYADDALLYVPLGQAHLIEQYVSIGNIAPELDSLGSGRWAARRRKAEKAVLDLAAELLERQAKREALQGYSFSPDSEWQLAFEKAFPYAETPDQARSIIEVKQDMEQARPMDRLICGDVGFGKTEVAIRAAFKAVLDGKQVAVLVPTTILAQQHWHTFTERMAEYPVRVEMLSRFIPARRQKKIVQAVSDHQVDIVIGTHRLLSKDMSVPGLGLVIIDEEQRFGVRHKEKLKKLRSLVDILTLSATPIPRTLYQSLTGARDMSTILTPPEERTPVKTLLIKNDLKIIREAILRELARGGQVFFLHNRVETIDMMCEKLQKLIPTARIAVGHGQMDEQELSETIEDFVDHTFDILVCTMIIESGVDMPNVNTIIVDNAHMFGLADLYQLRGRVGRSNRQAYAYLVVPGQLSLDSAARHRLKAILENTSLGSGYAIAMKDLEIRGAGNLLGPEQSGHIASIGFGLYCKMLQRAVQLLKSGRLAAVLESARQEEEEARKEEKPVKTDWRKAIPEFKQQTEDVEIHIPFAGNIPEDYVASAALRLDLFRRIGSAGKAGQLRNLELEMRDRFGPLPEETILALRIAEARTHARIRGVDSIEVIDGKIILRRKGKILTPTDTFPRVKPGKPLESLDIILAYLSRLKPLTSLPEEKELKIDN